MEHVQLDNMIGHRRLLKGESLTTEEFIVKAIQVYGAKKTYWFGV